MQLVLKEKVKWTRRKIKCEGETERITRGIKGTIAQKENKKGKGKELKGAISTKGEIKCMRRENKHVKMEK